jgi:hypothetical protein
MSPGRNNGFMERLEPAQPRPGPPRRRWWRAGFCIAALGGLGLLFAPGTADPWYEGRHLSEYVDDLGATYTAGDGGYTRFPVNAPVWELLPANQKNALWNEYQTRSAAAEKAVQAIGGPALPYLIAAIGRRESWTDTLGTQLPGWASSVLARSGIRTRPSRTYARRWQAVTALRCLHAAGCDLNPVVPSLRQLAVHPDGDIRLAARFMLGRIDNALLQELKAVEDPKGAESVPATHSQL